MNFDRLDWMLARGSGFTAFLLLSAATVAGLALSMRWATVRWPAVVTNHVHRHLTTLALWATGLHVLMLLVDAKSGIDLPATLVPFASGYRPVATALGVVGVYTLLAVLISTQLRSRIGHRRWRQIHGLAFVTYAAALLHGLLAGTDTGSPWSTFLYLTSGTLVAGLIALRIFAPKGLEAPPAPPEAPTPPATSSRPPLPPLPPRRNVDPRLR